MEFKSIEEAQKAYVKLDGEHKKLAEKGEKASKKIADLTTEVNGLKSELEEAKKTAQEAIEMANDAPASEGQKDVTVKIGSKTYAVAFGVDGLTKEELAKDKERCASMVKAGTAALVEVQ